MTPNNPRILLVDDLPAIHDDYRKILAPRAPSVPLAGMADFAPNSPLAAPAASTPNPALEIESVMQGEDAVRAVIRAREEGRPFALVFLDVRMPPGIDGVETATRLRMVDPDLQIVLCTAYSDYSFTEISKRFKESDGLLILKKPFDPIEVQQICQSLCRKWVLSANNKTILENLDTRIQQRTAELEHAKARLELALLGAEAANRAKADFLRCIGHELNTPLNGIMGAASIIELSADAESAELGRLVLQSAERLNRLFSRILRYLTIDPVPSKTSAVMNLQEIVNSALAPHHPVVARTGVQLVVDNQCPPALSLNGEAQQLSQALDCLVENAVKFTTQGRIDVRTRVENGNTLYIEVLDTGPGISEQQLDHLYRLFAPGDTRTNRKHEGIGIGLTFANRVAEYFGGRMDFRNREEGGSIFSLILPCSQVPSE